MSPAPPGEAGDQPEQDLISLLRSAQAHQRMAQQLIAQVVEMGLRCCSEERPDIAGGAAEEGRRVLTGRERDVAGLLVEGLSNRRIARSLEISERTVKNHLHSIFHKLGVADRTQAVILLMRGART